MFQRKKYIIIAISIIILICIIIVIFYILKDKPIDVIEKTLKIKLPASARIVNYSYYNDGDYFDAKILITEQSINDLKKQLYSFFGGIIPDIDSITMPNFENVSSWWDLNREDIEVCYRNAISGKKKWFKSSPRFHDLWAFISKNKNGQFYLYISY